MTRTPTPQDIWSALYVLDEAAPALCAELIKVYGTQRAVCKAIGVSPVHFNRMTLGRTKASIKMLETMCRAYAQKAKRP